ncbi:hypothetical protein PUNSTDRAFT_83280 [Punctularia strigosozonata HHB-11173 SS5]|uniref:uncharacterized protein n=1 Tax=Punctularia strigosozonata (strain HHB-11173) TaxID=741275 RepID=UPI000441718D|nr:uncharacterized protein PUNSTDRAFT_83280 [Punctularia strigosozonata HHB-11173 SS5]EIN11614.1 hypothetical protein PUNSTDRAFT_83280 [Punctularia strigosozonata HHB-11173 SS5]
MTPPPAYDAPASTGLTPYLRLPHLLSLTWLAYPILSLVFVVFRLLESSAASQDAATNAKADLLASCKAAEHAATAAASMPRYMAAATNQQIADAVNGTMNGARAALVLALTVMEAIINFIVDIYRSTFLCFVELVVRGGLSILISAVKELSDFIENTFNGLRTSIQNDIETANSAINSTINAINKVNPFSDIKAPQISVPSLTALENVTLPTDFEQSLESLNNSIPSFSEIKDKIESIIDTPFELLKKDINDTFANLTFDASVLPVPEQNTLAFCDGLDTSVVDDLGRDLAKLTKIGILILALAALLLLAGHCALEWYKWRCLKQHLRYTREAWTTDPTLYAKSQIAMNAAPEVKLTDHNLMMLQASAQHPLLTRIANQLAARLRLSPTQHTNLQWSLHYVFHPPALACFLIGFFGLLSVELQLAAVRPLEAHYQARAVATTADFSNTIAASMSASMYNQSAAYADDINARVAAVQSTINDGVFGWVNGTTTTLNDTLNAFYDDVQDAVSAVFNGTILESPVQEFIRCFIGSKVEALEDALTFLHNNLVVDIPTVNQSVLVLSPAQVDEATQPIAAAAVGGNGTDSGGVVGRLVNSYVASLKKERIMFALFLGLWGVVVLMALAIVWWHSYGQHWLEARRRRKWERQQRGPVPLPAPQTRDIVADEKGVQHVFATPDPFAVVRSPRDARRSSESFFDHSATPEPRPAARARFTISAPRRLMALGRKREGEGLAPAPAEKTPASAGWLQPFTRLFSRSRSSDDDDDAVSHTSSASFRARRPAHLTIAVDAASDDGRAHPGVDRASELKSAWSVSPGPSAPATTTAEPYRPWTHNIVPSPPPPGLFPVAPLTPKWRRKASVPENVEEELPPMQQQTRFVAPLPLHHAFLHHHQQKEPSPPPAASPAGTAGAPWPWAINALAPPPPLQQRGGPLASVDPFTTPFDDEHAVAVNPARMSFGPRDSRPSLINPFAGGVAI